MLLAIICALEASLFNLSFWTTLGLQPTTLYSGAQDIKAGEELTINLDQPIEIETLKVSASQPCDLTFSLTDEGFSAGYSITRTINPAVPKSTAFKLRAYGKVTSLTITPDVVYSSSEIQDFQNRFSGISPTGVIINEITANTGLPFQFSIPRVVGIFALVAIIWGFGSRRKMYSEAYDPARHRRILVASTTIICIIFTLFALPHAMFFGTMQTDSEGGLEYTYPRVYEAQYAKLAESFTQGVPYLLDDVPIELQESENPYDEASAGRAHANADTAYFDGHYYVYFGVLPVLVFYLPFYMLTGTGFPTFVGCLLCLYLIAIATTIILCQLRRRFFLDASLGALLLAQVCTLFGSMLIWVSAYPAIYHMPTALGFACLSWGAVCYLALPNKPKALAPGSLLLALVVACRPQLIIFALFMVPLGIEELKTRATGRSKAFCLIQALLPFVVVFALIGWYNFIRFGSPFDFGANYNLTTNDMNLRPMSVDQGLLAVFYQLFQLPDLQTTFPFFGETEFQSTFYEGVIIHEPLYGGIMWLCPFAWFCVALLFAKDAKLKKLAACMIAACVVVVVFDGLGAGILARYQLDFALPLMVVASIGFMYWMSVSGKSTANLANEADLYSSNLRDSGDLDYAEDSVNAASATSAGVNEQIAFRKWLIRAGVACLIISLIACVAICYRDEFYIQVGLTFMQHAFTL